MAWNNIDDRRAAVRRHLDRYGTIDTAAAKDLAKHFGCSVSAIKADTAHFINEGGEHTYHIGAGMRRRIRERDKDICQYCGEHCTRPVIDHIKPYYQGGKATPSNLVVACPSCNNKLRGLTESSKRAKLKQG